MKALFLCDANPRDQIEFTQDDCAVHIQIRTCDEQAEVMLSKVDALNLLRFLINSCSVDADFVLESIGQNRVEQWVSENNQCDAN